MVYCDSTDRSLISYFYLAIYIRDDDFFNKIHFTVRVLPRTLYVPCTILCTIIFKNQSISTIGSI